MCEREFVYKTVGDRAIELVFWEPAKKLFSAAPLLVLIPGGGWCKSDARSMYGFAYHAAEHLRDAGFAVAALSYRNFADDGVNMRQMAADVFDAVSWLAARADAFGIDPARVYTCGHSAGGHLSLLLALAPADTFAAERQYDTPFTVRGTAPLSAPCHLTDCGMTAYMGGEVSHLFAGCSPEDYALCSPDHWAAQGRRTAAFLAWGDADRLVIGATNSARLARLLSENGADVETVCCLHGGHCFEPIDADRVSHPHGEIQQQLVNFILRINDDAPQPNS